VTTAKPLLTAVVATPQSGTAGAFIVMDLLAAVGTFWHALHREEPQMARFLPRLVTYDGEPYRDLHGVQITPHGSFEDFPKPDIVIEQLCAGGRLDPFDV
jgi:transcriptional regulator GlxA family with amidase domain